MKKICVITTTHPAEDNRIFLKEVQTLLGKYKVVYITTGAITKKQPGLESINIGRATGGIQKRVGLNYEAFREAMRQEVDSYHFHDFDFILWAVLLRLIKGKPIIYDIHEDYPAVVKSRDYVSSSLLTEILSAAVYLAEMFCALFFQAAIVVNEKVKDRIVHVIGQTVVVANYPRAELFPKATSLDTNKPRKIIHLGNLNNIRGAEVIFGALSQTKVKNLELLVIGDIMPKKLADDLKEKYPKVTFEATGNLDYKEALEKASLGTAGIIGYLPLPNHIDASPNKIFEYMGLGLPIIAADLPSFKEIVNRGVGVVYESENDSDLADKLGLLDFPKRLAGCAQRGRDLFENEYNWARESNKLLELYEKVLG